MDGCWCGDYLGIEVKSADAYASWSHGLSEVQVLYAIDILEAGGLWMVTYSPAHAWETLERIRTEEYLTETLAALQDIQERLRAKWATTTGRNRDVIEARRRALRPHVKQRLATEAQQAEADRQLRNRVNRRFKRSKTPIPWAVLVHGINVPIEET